MITKKTDPQTHIQLPATENCHVHVVCMQKGEKQITHSINFRVGGSQLEAQGMAVNDAIKSHPGFSVVSVTAAQVLGDKVRPPFVKPVMLTES